MFLPDPFSLTWKKNEYAFNKYKIIISVSYTIFNFSTTKAKIKNYFWHSCYRRETEGMDGKKTGKVEVKK